MQLTKLEADYIIIGSGLTGSVIARTLADAGREVLVLERRDHVGGNVHDHMHQPSGIRIHTYGPHYFRTSSPRIWEFVNRFAAFWPYEAAIKSRVDGEEHNWPIAASYIREHVGNNWKPEFTGTPTNFEEAALSLMPRLVYEKFIKEYNEKQWGVPVTQLAADLCKRFNVREDDEPRLTPDKKHQGIPTEGYTAMMQAMLAGIDCQLNCDYCDVRHEVTARKMLIYTGPIDSYFDGDAGPLVYRGQQRKHTYLPNAEQHQSCGQVNTPQHADGPAIRILEWKQMAPPPSEERVQRGTVITTETPHTPDDPSNFEYPFPDAVNGQLYAEYRRRADALENVLICGRLGEYRYFDMDQAIGRAMMLAGQVLEGTCPKLG